MSADDMTMAFSLKCISGPFLEFEPGGTIA